MCSDSSLEGYPRQQGSQSNDRLRAGTVVVGHPEHQEQRGHGPAGHSATIDLGAQARQHFAGQDHPRNEASQQRRQAHPDGRSGDLGHQRQQVIEREANRRFRHTEPAVVIGHVTGVLRYPRHGQDVAVICSVGTDEVPAHQEQTHHRVNRTQLPPTAGQEASAAVPIEGIDAMQGEQGDHHHDQAQRHRDQLQCSGAGGEARIHGDGCAQPCLLCLLGGFWIVNHLRVDARDHRPDVIGDGAFVWCAIFVGLIGDPGPEQLAICGDVQCRVRSELVHLLLGQSQRHHVAHHDIQSIRGGAHEHAAQGGLFAVLRNGGQRRGLARIQVPDLFDRQLQVHLLRHVGDQGSGHTGQVIALRPGELGMFLLYGQNGGQTKQDETQYAGNDGEGFEPGN